MAGYRTAYSIATPLTSLAPARHNVVFSAVGHGEDLETRAVMVSLVCKEKETETR
jgi:hypothetical protein